MISLPAEWLSLLDQERGEIDRCLDELVAVRELDSEKLAASIAYSVLSPGKRLRPLLFLAVTRALGFDPPGRTDLIRAACTFELIHAGSLIHDDLPCMDDSELRRGKPTNHVVFGQAIATLSGDALLNRCYQCLLEACHGLELDPAVTVRVVRVVADSLERTVHGQALEIASRGSQNGPDLLMRVLEDKTAALFQAIAESAALVAGAPERVRAGLVDYARRFGIAFQIADDILDLVSTTEELGKDVQVDGRQSLRTYPMIHGLDAARSMVQELAGSAGKILDELPLEADLLRGLLRCSTVDRIR